MRLSTTFDVLDGSGIRLPLLALCGLFVILLLPFGAFYFYLLFLAVMCAERNSGRFAVLVLCIGAVISLAPLVALKMPLQDGGNDKLQYLDFMYTMHSVGMQQFLARQPELISFFSLHAAGELVGIGDSAFLLIFVVFFSFLLAVIWRAQYQVIPVFLVLFLSASSFFGTYGNVIRQAMAFPFVLVVMFSTSNRKSALFAFLGALAHIPSLIVTGPFVLYRFFGRPAIWAAVGLTVLALLVSKLYPGLFMSFGGDDSYLSTKINIYTTWDAYSVVGVAMQAGAIGLLSNALWRYCREPLERAGQQTLACASRSLAMMNMAALALVATYSYAKVFERIYIYFFVIAMMYLSTYLIEMRRGPTKALLLFLVAAYGVYGFAKNIAIQGLLYRGDPVGFLTESLFAMYHHFI